MSPDPAHPADAHALNLLTATTHGRLALSLRALPYSAPARHVVTDGGVLLRLHSGHGYHRACDGNVVAYGADSITGDGHGWSVQFVGTARLTRPADGELQLLGRTPQLVDGDAYEPAYLRIQPRFATVHTLGGGGIPGQRDASHDRPGEP